MLDLNREKIDLIKSDLKEKLSKKDMSILLEWLMYLQRWLCAMEKIL